MKRRILHERRQQPYMGSEPGEVQELIFAYEPEHTMYRIDMGTSGYGGKLLKWSDSSGWCYLAYIHHMDKDCHERPSQSYREVLDRLLELADKLHQSHLNYLFS